MTTHSLRLRTLMVLSALLLAISTIAACARTAAQPADPPRPQVTVADVVARDITEWDEFTGRLEAVNAVSVRPRVSGYISAVRFDEGALVRRGSLLFQIDPRPYQAEVDRLRAEIERARAVTQRATSELARARRLAAENAISAEEHDRRAAFAEEATAQATAVEAALRAAELNLEFTRVVAQIDGRVGRAIVTEGNLVSGGTGDATLLTTMVSLDPIYASFEADERAALSYQKGQRIRMALGSEDAFPHEGTMNFLDNQIDPETGTIRGRATFRNADRSLTPGLFVRLQLPSRSTYRGVLIQDRAIGTDLDKRFVYVVTPEQTIDYRAVTLGPIVDGLRVVRSGLAAGDLVVVNGLQRVRPGVKVEPVREQMDRRQS